MNETEAPGAGWQFDPTERHQLRWWDGSSWSDRVCDQAAQTIDSMEAILRAPLPIDDPSDGVLARRLRWQCVGGRTFRGAFRVEVLDSDERVVACVQYSGGLKTITVGEREYQAKTNFQWRSLVDLANDGEEVARWRSSAMSRKTPRWSILARDTPALLRVRTRVKGEPWISTFHDYAGSVAFTINFAGLDDGWARLGPLNLSDTTMLVACLAFDCARPSSGGGG